MYRASRTVKEGLLRCFLGHGSKPWVPSTSAGGIRELLSVPLKSQGYCAVGRGLSGLHWVWCNRRGPHLEWRQEPQGSSPFLTDRRVPAELGQESQASSCKEEWNSACLSSYSQGDRQLVELCLESAGFSGRCTRVSVPLRVVPSSTGVPFKRCQGIGFFSRVDRGIGVFQHVLPPMKLRLKYSR